LKKQAMGEKDDAAEKRRVRLLLGGGSLVLAATLLIFRAVSFTPAPVPVPPPSPSAVMGEAGLALTEDPALVFKKAFWRRPANDDKILHAERREWSDPAAGVKRWSWFLAVTPSPALLEWLESNPFSLATLSSNVRISHLYKAPTWFPKDTDGFQIQKNASSSFFLLHSKEENLIFATDSGYGFEEPMPEMNR